MSEWIINLYFKSATIHLSNRLQCIFYTISLTYMHETGQNVFSHIFHIFIYLFIYLLLSMFSLKKIISFALPTLEANSLLAGRLCENKFGRKHYVLHPFNMPSVNICVWAIPMHLQTHKNIFHSEQHRMTPSILHIQPMTPQSRLLLAGSKSHLQFANMW